MFKYKKSFIARLDGNGNLARNVANYGLDVNGCAIRLGQGEYTNFTIQMLEKVNPVISDYFIEKAMGQLEEDNILAACDILNINNYAKQFGIHVVYNVLAMLLGKNDIAIPDEYVDKLVKLDKHVEEKIKDHVLQVRNMPIRAKFKIISIGKSKKGGSVVPSDWLGRVFNNADELHKEMDKLDSRIRLRKPPVRFCCIYSMAIVEQNEWHKPIKNKKYDICLNYKNGILDIHFNSCVKGTGWLVKDSEPSFAIVKDSIVKNESDCIFRNNVHTCGVLVSRLQKCIRRGKKCPKTLTDAMYSLAELKPYNMPNHGFMKVSGCRQLCWRLFITIVEDAEPYKIKKSYFSLLDIFSLAILCQIDPDIMLNKHIVDKLVYTGQLVQKNDKVGKNWDWRKGKMKEQPIDYNCKSDEKLAFQLALKYMPMMSGDRRMLTKSVNYIENYGLSKLKEQNLSDLSDEKIEHQAVLAAYDMHCLPNMIIELQASLDLECYNYSTKQISGMIWDYSSKFNVRNNILNKKDDVFVDTLREIQMWKNGEGIVDIPNIFKKHVNDPIFGQCVDPYIGKKAFLLLFGKKVRFGMCDVIIDSSLENICKVKKKGKYINGEERSLYENKYIEYMGKENNVTINIPQCLEGYSWIDDMGKNKKMHAYVVPNSDNNVNGWDFYLNNIKVPFCDASKLIKKIKKNNKVFRCPKYIKKLLLEKPCYTSNMEFRMIHKKRKKKKDYKIYNWKKYVLVNNNNKVVWIAVMTRLYCGFGDNVYVGPVDRNGKKINRSINYNLEGTIWRILNILAMLYPNVLIIKGQFTFKLDKSAYEYIHMKQMLEQLCCVKCDKSNNKNNKTTIKTQLWDHQEKTCSKIFNGYVKDGCRGFGDASFVGAGKTLTAISVASKLNNHSGGSGIGKGFLVLLPSTKLYKTWLDEIEKHSTGFHILVHQANGNLVDSDGNEKKIKRNTIVISTLGRTRDHPFLCNWLLVIIDECLTVQNKDALQTEEAWRQVICSVYGVLMMSATFFRSRFDKMFYMLSMLNSGLPEEKEYLDTILSEHIVCFIPERSRKWITNITKYKMGNEHRKQYNLLKNRQNIGSDKMYQQLTAFIHKNIDYIQLFMKKIKDIELNENNKILVYCKSKKEADILALSSNGCVTRYPDKTGKHVVVSYCEGTYGLNDLVRYNVLLTRPPEPDKIDQMKGRLDRPRQLNDVLQLEYILLENTVEEAWLYRLDIANGFYTNHILPLAEFYNVAINC